MKDAAVPERAHHQGMEKLPSEATLDACEASSGASAGGTAEAAWKWEARAGGTARRVRVAPPVRDPRGSGQHCSKDMRAAPLGSTQVAASKRVRVRQHCQSECG